MRFKFILGLWCERSSPITEKWTSYVHATNPNFAICARSPFFGNCIGKWIFAECAARTYERSERNKNYRNPKFMNFPIKIFLLCPIPEEQKPINEYILSRDFLKIFWGKGIKKILETNSQKVFLFSVVFFFFFTFSSFFYSAKASGSLFVFLFFVPSFFSFFLLFFSWFQLQKRLNQARIFYEEASWFDGQYWQKPFFLLKNDRFLSTQQLQPFLQKIFTLLLFFFSSNLVFLLFFLLK